MIAVYAPSLSVEVFDKPPTVAGLVPAVGSSMISAAHNRGPADWIDPANLPAPVPWSNYSDPVTRTIAPSCNGVRPAFTRRVHPLGNYSTLYSKTGRIRNGRHEQWNPEVYSGDDFTSITPRVTNDPAPWGPRGLCIVDPYVTWRPHPTIPGNLNAPKAIGFDPAGRILYWQSDESIAYGGTVPGQVQAHDFAFYEPDRALFYTVNTGAGRIDEVDRHAAIAARVPGQLEDASLWVTRPFSIGYQKPTSIETLRDGTMFVCDETANAVYRVARDGSKTVEFSLSAPFAMRRRAAGDLVIKTLRQNVHLYDPVTKVLSANLMPAAYANQIAAWVQVAVDEYGVMGPVDEFRTTRSVGGQGNVDLWEFRANGAQVLHNPWGQASVVPVGSTVNCGEWLHYGWSIFYHIDQGFFFAGGFANSFPSIIRPLIASDVNEEPHDHNLWMRGRSLVEFGSTRAQQLASGKTYPRPSFTALVTNNGWSLLGCSCDYMAAQAKVNGWAWLETFIQGGMVGSVPRPEFIGYDLYALMYWICKNSQRYLSEGAPMIASMKAYILGKYPTAMTPTPAPAFYASFDGAVLNHTHLRGSYAGGQISVIAENAYGNAKTLGAGVLVDVVVDENRPAEIRKTGLANPWKVAQTLTPGLHALTCYSATPDHFSIANVVTA